MCDWIGILGGWAGVVCTLVVDCAGMIRALGACAGVWVIEGPGKSGSGGFGLVVSCKGGECHLEHIY